MKEQQLVNIHLSIIALVLIVLSGTGFISTVQASKPLLSLKPFVATYMVTAMGLEGINVTNSLSLDNNTQDQTIYHFKSYSMPVGLLAFKKDETRNEQSEGLIIDGQLHPLKYTFLQIRNKSTHRNVELIFDWDSKEVTNHHKHKNSKWVMNITEHTVDKLSYQLAMMLLLQKNSAQEPQPSGEPQFSGEPQLNKKLQPGKKFRLNIADGGRIKEYDFEIMGTERVTTPLGSYKTLKIQHHRYKKEKNITLWCAPELAYLPVKIIQEEPGKPDFLSTLISYQEGISGR